MPPRFVASIYCNTQKHIRVETACRSGLNKTYFTLLEHHKIEVLNALIRILLYTFPKNVFRYNFPNIFVHKVIAGNGESAKLDASESA